MARYHVYHVSWRKRLRPRKNGDGNRTASSEDELPVRSKICATKRGRGRGSGSEYGVGPSNVKEPCTTVTKSKDNSTEIIAKLKEENKRLKVEIESLRKEFAELRSEKISCKHQPSFSGSHTQTGKEAPPQDLSRDEVLGNLTELVRRVIALEKALLPSAPIRPPLAANVPSQIKSRAKGEKKKKRQNATLTQASDIITCRDQIVVPQHSQDKWEVVVNKKKKKQKRSDKDKVRILRAPRSTVVVMKLQPKAVERGLTYNEVLKVSIDKVGSLADIGISGLRYKKAATGAAILEMPGLGPESEAKVDALAEKLKMAWGTEDVHIYRPTKCAEVRISGLDESVTTAKVIAAVAQAGECSPDIVKCNNIRPAFNGTMTTIVTCPVSVAQKLGDGRRILVGWISAQVKILHPRPLRCYRCLQCGHVAAQRTSEVDYGNVCFRCGKPGHKAGECSAASHCVVCEAAGKPAEHRVGGGSCAARPNVRSRKLAQNRSKDTRKNNSLSVPAPMDEVQNMES